MLCRSHLEIHDNFEQGALHFYFALNPTNYALDQRFQDQGRVENLQDIRLP